MKTRAVTGGILAAMFAMVVAACDRKPQEAAEHPAAQPAPQKSGDALTVALVPFSPGGQKPISTEDAEGRRIMRDPEQIAAGKQLYSALNCVGCHFHGGGGIGPALMDDKWIYGDSIENIASTIREGRPNGMPSFRGVVPDEQIWQLAAYVRSFSHPIEGSRAAATTR